ncbi:sugar (and other) transporter family protein, partial [Vibrio parahaemolyticus EKP-028]
NGQTMVYIRVLFLS